MAKSRKRKQALKPRRGAGWWGLLVVILLPGLVYGWFMIAADPYIYYSLSRVPKAHAALLLGTAEHLPGGAPNPFFTARIEAAAELYKAGKVKVILVSGDNGEDNYNEPEAMKRELLRQGVPAAAIVMDHAGFRTLDSVVRAYKIFGQDDFIIVSQRFHLERALFIAHSKDIAAYGFAADDPVNTYTMVRITIREIFARMGTFLDCYILHTQPRYLGKEVREPR